MLFDVIMTSKKHKLLQNTGGNRHKTTSTKISFICQYNTGHKQPPGITSLGLRMHF